MKRFGTFELALGAGVLVLVTLPSMAAPPPPAPPASSMEREVRIIRVPRDGQGAPPEIAMDEVAGLLDGMPMGMPPGMNMGSRATLGVMLAPPKEGASAAAGVAVEAVTPGGGAALAGVQPGDRLLTVNGRKVATSAEVVAVMAEIKPGETVKVESLRDGKPRNFEVVSQQREARVMIIREDGGAEGRGPQGPGEPRGRGPQGPLGMQSPMVFMQGGPMEGFPERVEVTIDGPLAELELATLTPALGRYFGTDKGVLVVHANGALKLQDGDVLRAIGGRAPNDEQHAMRILGSYAPGETVKLDVLRDRKSVSLEAVLPASQDGPIKRRVRVQVGPPPAP
jgi:membrane-associated protease RseP (regulator of RpoE activity)